MIDGAIAQLVEHRTENPGVPSSILGGTTSIRKARFCRAFCFLLMLIRNPQLCYRCVTGYFLFRSCGLFSSTNLTKFGLLISHPLPKLFVIHFFAVHKYSYAIYFACQPNCTYKSKNQQKHRKQQLP